MLWGVALGDALGAPHEGYRRGRPLSDYTGHLIHGTIHRNRWTKETTPIPPGTVTDDTEMTLILARALVTNRGFDAEAVVTEYEKWANTHPRGIGKNTKALFQGVSSYKWYLRRTEKVFGSLGPDGLYPGSSESNGGLMRVSSAVCFGLECALADTRLSNPNQICLAATELYVGCLGLTLTGAPLSEIEVWMASKVWIAPVQQVVADVRARAIRSVNGKDKGWVCHSLYVALYCFFLATSFTEGIDMAIRFGGDTDTNGAIAGALLGIRFGYDEIDRCPVQHQNLATIRQVNPTVSDIDTLSIKLSEL